MKSGKWKEDSEAIPFEGSFREDLLESKRGCLEQRKLWIFPSLFHSKAKDFGADGEALG